MRDGWEAEAGKWAEFTRTPGRDSAHGTINLPALLALLPEPGQRTLDLGCGEGRLGRFLRSRGYRVGGVDASQAMIRLAVSHAVAASAVVAGAAIPHPIQSAGSFQAHDATAPFVIDGSYLDQAPADWMADPGGLRLTFHSEHRPIEAYSRALEAAGLLIEAIREVSIPDAIVAAEPNKRRWQRIPLFLHLRAVKP
jgi:SAM-dependent methyltransferase